MTTINFTRIKNDTNGNPRYVCHFLALGTQGAYSGVGLSDRYAAACRLANKIGGRKFHNKQYGGGIVFQSYNLAETVEAISRVTGYSYAGYTLS